MVRLLLIAAVLLLIHVFAAPFGYLAVRDACNKEGGLHIAKADNVDGYLHAAEIVDGRPQHIDCWRCAAQVADSEFEFVDFERTKPMRLGPPGLVRFQLGPADASNCMHGNQFDGLPVDKCVTVSRLEGVSDARYEYRRQRADRKALLGIEIRELRQTVYDLSTRKPIATYQFFDYATPAEEFGKFARSYSCKNSVIDPDDTYAFLSRVLRSSEGEKHVRD